MANYQLTHAETAYALDQTFKPSHLFAEETASAADATRVERITFPLFPSETATATDSVKVRVYLAGNRPDVGWAVKQVEATLNEDLSPGDELHFIVEDHFAYRTLNAGVLKIHNMRGVPNLHALVKKWVWLNGAWKSFVLVNENVEGNGFIGVTLVQPVTLALPGKRTGPQRLVYHEVTVTNNNAAGFAYVVTSITGWAGKRTSLPVDLPGVY